MVERVNRRDQIVETAAVLFTQQSYAATSVRQIAEAVGCTEAALYYHFKEGKRALLQAVIECNTPDFVIILDNCRQVASLSELIRMYSRGLLEFWQQHGERVQWMMAEFPNLNDGEKTLFNSKKLKFHAELSKLVKPFVQKDEEAESIAWIVMMATFGYQQTFMHLELDKVADFSIAQFSEKLANYLSCC